MIFILFHFNFIKRGTWQCSLKFETSDPQKIVCERCKADDPSFVESAAAVPAMPDNSTATSSGNSGQAYIYYGGSEYPFIPLTIA